MTDELKQWEYDRGYDKGRADREKELLMPYDVESIEELVSNSYEKGRAEREKEIVDLIYLFEKTWNKESHKRVPHKAISELIEFIYQTDTKERVAKQMQKGAENE